jgi:hypothetical protein
MRFGSLCYDSPDSPWLVLCSPCVHVCSLFASPSLFAMTDEFRVTDTQIIKNSKHCRSQPPPFSGAAAALQLPVFWSPLLSVLVQVPDNFHMPSSRATSKPPNNKLAVRLKVEWYTTCKMVV